MSYVCTHLGHLVAEIGAGAGFALITEEALRSADLRALAAWVSAQAEWSDFPFIVLTSGGGGFERNPAASRFVRALGNVSFLERPFHPTTLISMSASALRGRRRQYDARARLLELQQGRERLVEVNESLERRVEQRTVDLRRAYDRVLEESRQRQAAEEQLRQVQKLEMIGELTGGVAHDFNNLLTAILGNLSLLRKALPAEDVRAHRLIESAVQGANRGAALTQRMLAFARRQTLQVAPTDVVALVEGVKALLERSVGPQVALSFELTSSPAVALIDANQVELALLNLVVNARDAMPDGGALTISVEGAKASSSPFVVLSVTDTGAGMDAATLERAIDPFFTTKGWGKGTGLGLSMVHGLAVQQNGALRLKSEVGVGTRAELHLPVTDQPVEARAETSHAPAPMLRSARIMLVDDDALIAMSSADMLLDLGHEVVEARSGKQALELLRTGAPVDLLITDFAMPGMTGAQLIEEVRGLFPDLPVLLATGYAELPGGRLDAVPRIGKPYTQPQLAGEVAKLLNGGSR